MSSQTKTKRSVISTGRYLFSHAELDLLGVIKCTIFYAWRIINARIMNARASTEKRSM